MGVWYRQVTDGQVTDEREIAAHSDRQTDDELLAAKAQGAEDKGWTVEWTGAVTFTATKDRFGGSTCVRYYWIE